MSGRIITEVRKGGKGSELQQITRAIWQYDNDGDDDALKIKEPMTHAQMSQEQLFVLCGVMRKEDEEPPPWRSGTRTGDAVINEAGKSFWFIEVLGVTRGLTSGSAEGFHSSSKQNKESTAPWGQMCLCIYGEKDFTAWGYKLCTQSYWGFIKRF